MPYFQALPKHLRALLFLFGLLLAALAPAQQVAGWGNNNAGQCNAPAGLFGVIQVAGGGYHTLALKSDHTVAAWGWNASGQCDVPAGLSGVSRVVAGYTHSIALKTDGTVVAWGDNSNGQCNVPSGLAGVAQVAAGRAYSLALKGDGTVVAWGNNEHGQCNVPAGLSGVARVAAGAFHALALKEDGTVVGWGENLFGQCNAPAGLTDVVGISAGQLHSLALKSDGTVVAWGYNGNGECNVPDGLSGVVQVSTNSFHCMALKSDGTVVSWGEDLYGETQPPTSLSCVQISAGAYHSLALLPAGVDTDQRSLYAGGSATGAVSVYIAPGPGGSNFGLSTDSASVHVPGSVVVTQNAHFATFPITTDPSFSGDQDVHIYALRSGTTYTSTIHIKGDAVALSLSQTSVVGGSTSKPILTVSIASALPTDLTLSLSTADPIVRLPATVTIPAGQTSAKVAVGHGLVAVATSVDLTASYNGNAVATAPLGVRPLSASILFVPSSVSSGQSSTGVLQLNAALAAPLDISVTSGDNSLLTVPANIRVLKGDKAVYFPVQASTVAKSAYVPVTAYVYGKEITAKLQILPPPTLSVLSVPTYAYGNQVVTGLVQLRAPAPAGGAKVTLLSNAGVVAEYVIVPEGETTATFPITLYDVPFDVWGGVTASAGGVTINKQLDVRPLTISSLSLSTSTVTGGTAATGTVYLNIPVGVDTVVPLTSDNSSIASVPGTVTIPAGSQSATFGINTTHLASSKNVKITASKNGTSAYRTLKVTP